jgi:hypothetical protein
MVGPMIVSILVRRLREGKTYEDFREAWLPEKGFGWPTRVVTAQRLDDPREIVTIGFSDVGREEAEALLSRVGLEGPGSERTGPGEEPGPGDEHLGEVADEQLARRGRISDVIEPEMTRAFYVQVADDDLT